MLAILLSMNKKLGTLTLSGLMIAPIFGSGIILLPPLLFNEAGQFSLIVWIIMLGFGFLFAMIFGQLSSMYKGDGGVSLATKEALGIKYQLLTSWYLIFATLFGPVAVMLVAGEFMKVYFPHVDITILGFFIQICTYILLLLRVSFLGKVMMVLSYAIVFIFSLSSIYVLCINSNIHFEAFDFDLNKIGYTFLLAFWAIVGWEVVGYYSNEAKDLNSLKRAVILSAIIFSLIYLLVNTAIVFGDFEYQKGSFSLALLLYPLFGKSADVLLLVASVALCVGTLVLFVGGSARLIASLKLTTYTSKRLQNGSPIGALNALTLFYIVVLCLVKFDILNLSILAAIANSFFIANALIGLFTAVKLFERGFLRSSAIVLCFIFLAILLFANFLVLMVIFGLFVYTYRKKPLKI